MTIDGLPAEWQKYLKINEKGPVFFRREIQRQQQNQKNPLPKEQIPDDPQQFYQDFGLLIHPYTGKPVPQLTAYQVNVWKAGRHPYRLIIKSQKVGLSTSVLLEDFWHAITDCKGREILIIAQTVKAATEHLYTLRNMVRNSKKYAKYLITMQEEGLSRDEVTKATVMYIRNPDNAKKPTRIIALGPDEQSIWSWKNVKFIHVSDITVAPKLDYSPTLNAAMTRLGPTRGKIIIETPPRGPTGKVYEIYKQDPRQFKVITVKATEAVDAGVISQEFLDGEAIRLGPQYPMYYEAEFTSYIGNIFAPESILNITKDYDYTNWTGFNVMGIDPAYGFSSKFGICVINYSGDGIIRVIHAGEEEADFGNIIDKIESLCTQYDPVKKIMIDASSSVTVKGLKINHGEDINWDESIKRAKKEGWNWMSLMYVIPWAFGIYGRDMLNNTKYWIEQEKVYIHKDFDELVQSLNTATLKESGILDKHITQHSDVFDALRLALFYFRQDKERKIEI